MKPLPYKYLIDGQHEGIYLDRSTDLRVVAQNVFMSFLEQHPKKLQGLLKGARVGVKEYESKEEYNFMFIKPKVKMILNDEEIDLYETKTN